MESAQQHDSKQASPAPVSFKARAAGRGTAVLRLPQCDPLLSEHGTGATPSLHPFAVYAGWGLTGAGIVLAALAMLAKRADRRTPTSPARRLWWTGACLVAIGVQFMLPLYTQLTLPFAEPAMFGLAFGAGLAMLATAWGSVFARLEPEKFAVQQRMGHRGGSSRPFRGRAAFPLSHRVGADRMLACHIGGAAVRRPHVQRRDCGTAPRRRRKRKRG